MITTDGQNIGHKYHQPMEDRAVKIWEDPRKEDADMHGNGNGMRRHRRVMTHLTSLLRVALYLTPSREEAEQLVQDVVVDACQRNDDQADRAGDKYVLFSDLTTRFLHRYNVPIGRRPAVSNYRQEDRVFQDILMEPTNAAALGHIMDEISPMEIKDVIRDLPPDCRLLIVLSFIEKFSSADIAGMIGVQTDLVRSNLAYCREVLLRKVLSDGTEMLRARKMAEQS
jgi:RNA polymerase sigma factor (sigma-70 family)